MEDINFGAISIDNSTLKGNGYKFKKGLLAKMRQLKESHVQVIQTDIVHNEAIKHIAKEVSKTKCSIDKALQSAENQLEIDSKSIQSSRELLSIDDEDHEVAGARLKGYYEDIGANVIDSSKYIDLALLMKMYFDTKAPFETGKNKKNEFPDAIALLSLEGWAEENDINVIAVSEDKGWKNYTACHSKRITLVSSLAEALETLAFQKNILQNNIESIITHIRKDFLHNNIKDQIKDAIIHRLDGCEVTVTAYSAMHNDCDETSAAYISHKLDCDKNGLVEVKIIQIDKDLIVLKSGAEVEAKVEAAFSFSVHDRTDKDYTDIGGGIYDETEETYHTDILLTMEGDLSEDLADYFDNLWVSEIEALDTIKDADFGEISPHYECE